MGGNQGSPSFKNLQFGYSHISKPLYGNSTKGKKSLAAYIHKYKRRTQDTVLDLPLDIITGTGTGITGPDPSHIPAIAAVTVRIAHTHTEATPDHITDTLTEALHITITQALIITTATHHPEGHPHTEAHPHTHGITADLEHSTPHKLNKTTSSKPLSSSSRTTVKHQDMKHKKVTIDEPQSEYYNSDDASSDSEDDLN